LVRIIPETIPSNPHSTGWLTPKVIGFKQKPHIRGVFCLWDDLKAIDNSIFKIDSELNYLKSRSMTPDDLLVYLKEIVPYMKEMGDKNKPLEL
jgi:hypothetical protein